MFAAMFQSLQMVCRGRLGSIGKYTNAITLCLACRTEVEGYISFFERCEYKKGEVCVSDVMVMI